MPGVFIATSVYKHSRGDNNAISPASCTNNYSGTAVNIIFTVNTGVKLLTMNSNLNVDATKTFYQSDERPSLELC